MYSAHNKGKSIVVQRFIRTLKKKICNCMTSISKYVYIDKLGDIVNKYNNTYHRTIKMKYFYEVNEEFQKTNQKEIRVEKVTTRKGDKLYVQSKGYDNSFNSFIYNKDIV